MNISLNGKVPTQEELELLSHAVPASFSLGEWQYYEENIEWDDMEIVYPNGDVLQCASYTGLWEMIALESKWDLMSVELKMDIIGDLFSHLLYFYKHQEEADEEIELFVKPD